MEVRFFFIDGTHQDIQIETYFELGESAIRVYPEGGEPYTLENVEAMVKIK